MYRHWRTQPLSSRQLHGLELGELDHRGWKRSVLELPVACGKARRHPNIDQRAFVECTKKAYKLAVVYLGHVSKNRTVPNNEQKGLDQSTIMKCEGPSYPRFTFIASANPMRLVTGQIS